MKQALFFTYLTRGRVCGSRSVSCRSGVSGKHSARPRTNRAGKDEPVAFGGSDCRYTRASAHCGWVFCRFFGAAQAVDLTAIIADSEAFGAHNEIFTGHVSDLGGYLLPVSRIGFTPDMGSQSGWNKVGRRRWQRLSGQQSRCECPAFHIPVPHMRRAQHRLL